jgi:malate dehydrogenase (oxaloacetate-decarboxylating)
VLPSFNDDIQGTAAVTVAALIAGTRVSRFPLHDQRVVILGAGAAGVGIGRLIRRVLADEGVAGDDLVRAVVCLDGRGLVVNDGSIRDEYRRELALPAAMAESMGLGSGRPRDLAAVVRAVRPTALVGTSGELDTFPEDVIREMARHVDRPVVLPLSNPTSQCEARPADVLAWTNGRALVATGSPFPPVQYGERTFVVGQANNAFVFPGIGLGDDGRGGRAGQRRHAGSRRARPRRRGARRAPRHEQPVPRHRQPTTRDGPGGRRGRGGGAGRRSRPSAL